MPQDLGQSPVNDWKKELTSGSAYPATFGFGGNAGVLNATNASAILPNWIQVIGAGTVVVVNQDGTSATLTCTASSETFPGVIKSVTSMSATRVRVGFSENGLPEASSSTAATVIPGSLGPALAIAVSNQATLSGVAQTIDGVALNTPGMRVYLAKQTTAAQNGMWVIAAGNWTRPADWAAGATIPLGTQIQIAPGGTANFAAFGSTWYVDSASGVVDTGTITAYPVACKGVATLSSASPSTVVVSSLWIKHATGTALSLANETTAANGVKGVLVAGAGTGTLTITGPNTVTDVISYVAMNG